MFSQRTTQKSIDILSVIERNIFDSFEMALYQNYTSPYEINIWNSNSKDNFYFIYGLETETEEKRKV
jgi:hypothetical protein